MFAQEIEVTGKKRTLGDQPAATSEIPVSDYAGRFETLEDILEKETSVRVKRYGGPGSQSSISVRGSNANQTNLYLDGIPLNNAVSGEANLADYNLDGVGSIQVFRSGQSSGFSGSAIGGSVNLVPERGESGTRLRLRGGTERTIDVAARAGGSRNPEEAEKEETEKAKVDPSLLDAMRAQWSVSGHTGRSDQTYKYRNNNGTPVFNTFDDHDDRRKNAWYRDDGFTGYASAGVGNTDLKILDDFTYRMHGVPGPGSRQTEKTHRELTRNTTGIGSDTRGLGVDWIRLETRAYYTYYRESFFDPLQEFSTFSPNSSGKLDVYGIHLMPSLYFPVAFQTIRFLFAEEREDYHQEIRNRLDQKTENVPARFRRHTSLHAEDEFSFFKKRLIITPSVRYELYRDEFPDFRFRSYSEFGNPEKRRIDYTNASLFSSIVLARISQAEFRFRAGGAKEERMPTFLELFGERGSVIGNSNLKPEKSESSEGGFSLVADRQPMSGEFSITLFRKNIRDMILFVPNSQFSLRPENVDAARITGVEASAKMFIMKRLRLYATYTYQRAINMSDVSYLKGKYLPLRPLHDLHSGLSIYAGKWEMGAEADFTGAVFRDRTNEYLSYQAGRWVYNAYLTFAPLGRGERELIFGLEMKNVLDQRMEDVIGYPLPGRTLYGTINYKF